MKHIPGSKVVHEFKEFIARGNVIDLAVGVIIGAAFGKIVNSLVTDVIMPPIGALMNGHDFSSYYFLLGANDTLTLTGKPGLLLPDAEKLGAIGYGAFLNAVLQFFIVAVCIFLIVKLVNNIKRMAAFEDPPPAPPTKSEVLLEEIRDLLRQQLKR
ncbi:MAG: large-conductance mechanosensitive channel protein MscL [Opitutales bacterium]|jgi:large conductance mechanosensitive channel